MKSKIALFESLESRRLLANVTLGTTLPTASETDPANAGIGKFIVRRDGATTEALNVNYSIAGTATNGTDYITLNGVARILAGKAYGYVSIVPIDDVLGETFEKVTLTLLADAAYTVASPSVASVTINDNEPAVSVSVKANASETDPTVAGLGKFLVRRTGSTSKTITVFYHVRSTSTASEGNDFTTLAGSVKIGAGKAYSYVNITPVDDATDEINETVILNLNLQPGSTFGLGTYAATMTLADNDSSSGGANWWDTEWGFRTPITVNSGSFTRTNQPVDFSVNFTTALSQAGGSGALITNSIRVLEVDSNHNVLDDNVPFQFDQASNFNATTNAAGTLVFLLENSTSASTNRRYDVYFDTTGSFSPPSFTNLVTTTDNVTDEGQTAIKIDTQSADYWLQKENGGFSSITDNSGNDWLGFSNSPGSQGGGEFRGVPNAVFPGGGFHAGFVNGATSIISTGPLKSTIETTSSIDKQISGSPFTYKMRYEIYPNFVRATMVQAGDSYWFLYEGTPGGSVDGNDTVVQSDGTTTSIDTTINDTNGLGSSNGQEWAYFRDSAVDKFMYYAHNTEDNIIDTYYRLDSNGSMTVFGFGRDNSVSDPNRQKLTAQNNIFTFGIADGGGNFNNSAATINGQYQDLTTTGGTAEHV